MILLVYGPNLNLLGEREPEVYGRTTLAEIDAGLREQGAKRGATVDAFQSSHVSPSPKTFALSPGGVEGGVESPVDDSRIVSATRYGPAGPGPEGSLMSATFEPTSGSLMQKPPKLRPARLSAR